MPSLDAGRPWSRLPERVQCRSYLYAGRAPLERSGRQSRLHLRKTSRLRTSYFRPDPMSPSPMRRFVPLFCSAFARQAWVLSPYSQY